MLVLILVLLAVLVISGIIFLAIRWRKKKLFLEYLQNLKEANKNLNFIEAGLCRFYQEFIDSNISIDDFRLLENRRIFFEINTQATRSATYCFHIINIMHIRMSELLEEGYYKKDFSEVKRLLSDTFWLADQFGEMVNIINQVRSQSNNKNRHK